MSDAIIIKKSFFFHNWKLPTLGHIMATTWDGSKYFLMSLTSIGVKYSNSRIIVNLLSERQLGFDCADNFEITLRQNTVVLLRRKSVQTQAIKCSNLGVLPATFESKRELMKEKLELIKVARGCPKVKTIWLLINKSLRLLLSHFQFRKELKWLRKTKLLLWLLYQWSLQSYRSSVHKMSRCLPQEDKNYISIWWESTFM